MQVCSDRALRDLPRHKNLFPHFLLDQTHVFESLVEQREFFLIRDFDSRLHLVPFLYFARKFIGASVKFANGIEANAGLLRPEQHPPQW